MLQKACEDEANVQFTLNEYTVGELRRVFDYLIS